MTVLCGMPTIQYSSWSTHLSLHTLFTSCIRQCLVSCACAWVISALYVVLFTVSDSGLLFFHNGQRGSTAAYLVYPISDVAENLGRFLVRSVQATGMTLNWFQWSCPKSARTTPDSVLRVLQMSSKSVHVRRSYSRMCEHRQNAL